MSLRILTATGLALALGACSTGYDTRSDNNRYDGDRAYSGSAANCNDCGVVQRIESYSGERRTSGVGAVAGAIVGGALGNQVGSGDGKKVATVAGAVAGGIAGNAIERNRNQTWYDVTVRMNDGRVLVFSQNDLNGIREGSRIMVRNDRVQLN